MSQIVKFSKNRIATARTIGLLSIVAIFALSGMIVSMVNAQNTAAKSNNVSEVKELAWIVMVSVSCLIVKFCTPSGGLSSFTLTALAYEDHTGTVASVATVATPVASWQLL